MYEVKEQNDVVDNLIWEMLIWCGGDYCCVFYGCFDWFCWFGVGWGVVLCFEN